MNWNGNNSKENDFMIDIQNNREKLHPLVIVAGVVIAAALVIVGVFAIKRRGAVVPAHDLEALTVAVISQDRSVQIGNQRYAYVGPADEHELHLTDEPVNISAYHAQLGTFGEIRYLTYFAALGAPPDDGWFISFYEDGSGAPTKNNLTGIYQPMEMDAG